MSEPHDARAFPLRGKRVLLGVTGGIAAYKAAELTRLLTTAGAEVRVVMTAAARELITPLTLQTLSGHPVHTDLFDLGSESQISHIALAEQADLVLVAPATADVIGRMAAGMGDDLLTTLLLVSRAPLLLAPAMNTNMWAHPLVQANLRRLIDVCHAAVVGPGEGFLACRAIGPGRMAEPADIVEAAARLLTPKDLAGRRVVVSAGPTYEALDPVRFIGNRSSGKMGYALARAAAARGAQVTLVSGPTALAAPLDVELVSVESAREMQAAIAPRLDGSDLVIMAAAVADYRAAEVAPAKLHKEDLGAAPRLALAENPDLLAGLARARRGGRPILVGFAAETEDLERRARAKLARKGCDLIVGNDVSEAGSGFGSETNRVTVVGPGDAVAALPAATKHEVAHMILDRIAPLLPDR
jgi:phosphopantothenoylcysteine decarboxylase / phosphopantothenate---cysteine ligase